MTGPPPGTSRSRGGAVGEGHRPVHGVVGGEGVEEVGSLALQRATVHRGPSPLGRAAVALRRRWRRRGDGEGVRMPSRRAAQDIALNAWRPRAAEERARSAGGWGCKGQAPAAHSSSLARASGARWVGDAREGAQTCRRLPGTSSGGRAGVRRAMALLSTGDGGAALPWDRRSGGRSPRQRTGRRSSRCRARGR